MCIGRSTNFLGICRNSIDTEERVWWMLHKFPRNFQHFDAHCRIFLGNPSMSCRQLPNFLGICGNFSDVEEYARWMLYKFPRKLWNFDGHLTEFPRNLWDFQSYGKARAMDDPQIS